MFTRSLPKKGDIFARPKRFRFKFSLRLKPKVTFKTTGIFAVVLILFFGISTVFSTGQTSLKQLASPAPTDFPAIVQHDDDHKNRNDTNRYYTDVYGPNYNIPNYNNYNGYDNYNGVYGYFPPISIQPIQTNPDFSRQQPTGQNVSQISQQIIANQQQIGGQMQNCVNTARQGANQIISLRQQVVQLERQRDSVNDQMWRIDTSTPAGQSRRDAMDRQVQQIQRQIDTLNENINRTQEQYNANNDRCRQGLDQLLQQREDNENRLNDAFNQGMDIRTDLPI